MIEIDFFDKALHPKGIIVIVKGKHTCILLRGNKSNTANITYETRGEFTTSQKLMQDFLALSELKQQDLSI